MIKKILISILFILSIASYAQTWNKLDVNYGAIEGFSQLFSDENGNPCVFYRYRDNLMLASRNSANWEFKQVTAIPNPYSNYYPFQFIEGVQFNSEIHLIIKFITYPSIHNTYYSYFRISTSGELLYSEQLPSQLFDQASFEIKDDELILAFVKSSRLYIKKRDLITDTWSTEELIDESLTIGGTLSLSHLSDGRSVISYYASAYGDLKLAIESGGEWHIYEIDKAGDVGNYSKLLIDDNNQINILYYDATNQELKQAKIDPSQL